MSETPKITLTDFVKFVSKNGGPRLTHVKQVKARGDYDPTKDFWKILKDGIVKYHKEGSNDKALLDKILLNITNSNKINNYPAALSAYKSFIGRNSISWFTPGSATWRPEGIEVKIKPELGLEINGVKHHIKLYFNKEPIGKDKAEMILFLLQQELVSSYEGDAFALLDVQKNKLFIQPSTPRDLSPLLMGEAVSFASIWNNI